MNYSIKRFTSGVLTAGMILSAMPLVALASSHREAPLIAGDPKADATDLFAFRSPDATSTVTLIANYLPFEEPAGGPNFYSFDDNVLYEIKIDNNGDAQPDISYQFRFKSKTMNLKTFLYNTGPITSLTDTDFNIRQTYTVTKVQYENGNKDKTKNKPPRQTVIATDVPVPPVNIGPKSTPNYAALQAAAVTPLTNGGQVFAGQSDDPFFVELGGLFDLLTIRNLPGNVGGGIDGLKGYNVQSIALQIPITDLTNDGRVPETATSSNAIIGVWTTSSRQSTRVLRFDDSGRGGSDHQGDWVQISRLGAPLVNEVVIPLLDKDVWNSSKPSNDAQFANYVANPELGTLLNALYGIAVPPQGPFGSASERDDLVAIFLTGIPGLTKPANVIPAEELRLNLAIAPTLTSNKLGVLGGDVQGYPNGRRLADDVTDISIRAVAGAAYSLFHPSFTPDATGVQLGDGVDTNDVSFRLSFPYLALPHQGFDSMPHRITAPSAATSTATTTSTGGMSTTTNGGAGGMSTIIPTTSRATIIPTTVTARPGEHVDFNGRHFGHEETVTIYRDGRMVQTAHADGGGNFSTGSVVLPTTPGTYIYTFVGQATGESIPVTVIIIQ